MGTDLVKLVEEHSGIELANGQNVSLMNKFKEAKKHAAYWKKEVETLQTQVQRLMGDSEIALIHGEPVFTAIPIDRLNESQFKKEEPELHKIYLHEVTKEELDTDLLKRARPDIWARFAVRPLKEV